MKLLEKILVPIDVNINSTKQIDAAVKIAKAYNSAITLLYVVPDSDLNANLKQILLRSCKEALQIIKNNIENEGIVVEAPRVEFGNIVQSIVHCANVLKANLVVIGENGENKRKHYKLSAKSEQILRAMDVPVLLISENNKTSLTHILCPVDFSAPSARALRNAIALAKTFNANLIVLYVFEPLVYVSPRIKVDLTEENQLRLQQAKEEMRDFVKDFDFNDVNPKIEVVSGRAYQTILNIIKEEKIDLLLMGTNGRTGLSAFIMGNVTQSVIREIPCSFLTVKKTNVVGTSKTTYL
jgi:nucleotide-binding universal stress UspA family protein